MHNVLFVLGPAEVEKSIRDIGSEPLEYTRTKEHSEFLKIVFKKLQKVFKTSNPVYILASSGTGAMEFAMVNMQPTEGYSIGYVSGGNFGERWGDIAKSLKIPNMRLEVEHGKSLKRDDLINFLENNKTIETLFVTHNETSTGVLTDLKMCSEICHKYNVMLVVDAVSSLGVNELNCDELDLDVVISSSQKALALPPGLSFAMFSERALKHSKKVDAPKSFYFDVSKYHKDWSRGQTPFTPAGSLIKMLDARLDHMLYYDYKTIYTHRTKYLRELLKDAGFTIFGENLANCVTCVEAPEGINALDIVEQVKLEGFQLAPCAGDDAKKYFRIGNFGDISSDGIYCLVGVLSNVVSKLKKQN